METESSMANLERLVAIVLKKTKDALAKFFSIIISISTLHYPSEGTKIRRKRVPC